MPPLRHRLTLKLALVIAMGITMLHGVFGYLRVQRELGRFRQDMSLDHLAISHALGVAMISTAERAGQDAARRLVVDADLKTDRAQITWTDEPAPADVAPSVWGGRQTHRTPFAPPNTDVVERDGTSILRTRTVVDSVGLSGVLQIEESMEDEHDYVVQTILRTTVMTVTSILLSVAIIFAAGLLLIDRRLRPLLRSVARIGQGDFSAPLRWPGKDEMSVLATSINQMAANLAALHAAKERETQQRLAALEQLRHAERLATVGRLAAGVAHELGTPLNVVTARAKMIARGESRDDEAKDDARVIAEQGERITRIIRQLLDFARAPKPRRSQHDLLSLCRDAKPLLEPLAAKRRVSVEVTGESVLALVDAGQIHQVITNLIVNGIHAQPSGGRVRLTVERSDSSWARLVVEDDGPGITPDIRDRVFEPFFSTKDVGEGTGLGLSVSYGIVREHGGRLEVADGALKGACLVASLPLDPE